MSATDLDSGTNGQITFSIDKGNDGDAFSIDSAGTELTRNPLHGWNSGTFFPKLLLIFNRYKVDSLLRDTSFRGDLVKRHLKLVPAFLYSLYLTLYRMLISLRWTLSEGLFGSIIWIQ